MSASPPIFHFVFVLVYLYLSLASLAPYFAEAAANLPELLLLHVVFVFSFAPYSALSSILHLHRAANLAE